jgi:hypothetical protein
MSLSPLFPIWPRACSKPRRGRILPWLRAQAIACRSTVQLLVQNLEEFRHSLERLLMPVAGVDDAIAIALQRFRFGFA